MKTKKRRVEIVSFYDHTGLEKHFSGMAKKGWLIENITAFFWTYRRIEPQELHFAVAYYPRASAFDSDPSREQQTFHDFCAHTGWQLACTWNQLQVFYNEKESPIPLETDPELEIETLHNACKKSFLPVNGIMLALAIVRLGLLAARMFKDPIGVFSNSGYFFAGFCWVIAAAYFSVELTAYGIWYLKAKKAAKDGIFVNTPGTKKFQIGILVLVGVGIVGWLLNLVFADDPIYPRVAPVIFAYAIALVVTVNGIHKVLKRMKASRGTNRALTIIACIVLSFVMTGAVHYLTGSGYLEKDREIYNNIPLTIEDLTGVESGEYTAQFRKNGTVLIDRTVVHQYPGADVMNTSGMPQLHYTVITVKLPFLYSWCKNQFFNGSIESFDTIYAMEYAAADAASWGAKEAYRQLDEHGREKNSFLLCYEDGFVLIHFDWDPTEEQMEIVRQKLAP